VTPVHELVVNEIFGPTVQGEGPAAGRIAGFIRLMGCNLTCSWCDTKQTWDARAYDLRAEARHMTAVEIMKQVQAMNVRLVILTGGEPLLQQNREAFRHLLRLLHAVGIQVHVETNGTVVPGVIAREGVDQFVVSPKLMNAGMPMEKTINPRALGVLRDRDAHFKFVCRTEDDVLAVARIVVQNHIPARRVWVMPEGITAAAVCDHLARIADMSVLHGFNITPRLHVLAWGSERGR
jgi:7-carboxy-7-deazaguanine synthase